EGGGVGEGALDVMGVEPPVVADRLAVSLHQVRRFGLKSAFPHESDSRCGGCLARGNLGISSGGFFPAQRFTRRIWMRFSQNPSERSRSQQASMRMDLEEGRKPSRRVMQSMRTAVLSSSNSTTLPQSMQMR